MKTHHPPLARRELRGLALNAGRTVPTQGPRLAWRDDTVRWPLWKSALLLIGFCSAFWVSLVTAVWYLLG